jgi:hypothetical protein
MGNLVVLAEDTAQITAADEYCAGTARASDGRLLAPVYDCRGKAKFGAFAAVAALARRTVHAAAPGTKLAVFDFNPRARMERDNIVAMSFDRLLLWGFFIICLSVCSTRSHETRQRIRYAFKEQASIPRHDCQDKRIEISQFVEAGLRASLKRS